MPQPNNEVLEYIAIKEVIVIAARSALELEHPSDLRYTRVLTFVLHWNREEAEGKRLVLQKVSVEEPKDQFFNDWSPDKFPLYILVEERRHPKTFAMELWLNFDPLRPLYVLSVFSALLNL